jgi:hypothetical protein
MHNQIQEVREEIKKYFSEKNKIADSERIIHSPKDKYRLLTEEYKQDVLDRNWTVIKVKVYEESQKIFEFITSNDIITCRWIVRDEVDYLIYPEDLEGQSILDLTNKQIYSFTSHEDPFIWINIIVSPDKKKLAVDGCYWACPYELVIYDITDLTTLPYPEIKRETIYSNKEIIGWQDNQTVILKEDSGNESIIKING